jgi:hypothetical protein
MIVILSLKLYKPVIEKKEENVYFTPPSPWSQDEIPVEGEAGKCRVYTFVGDNRWSPAKISYSSINSCNEGENCSISRGNTCIDPDQIMAAKYVHVCEGDVLLAGTSGKCLTQNGLEVEKGYIEEYYSPCTVNEKDDKIVPTCKGELSILAFNTNIKTTGPSVLTSAVCLSIPTLTQEICDMSASANGFPTQLVRIERADFTGTKFVENGSGQYARIVNRLDGTVLAPDFSSNQLKWIKKSDTYYLSQGYWWILLSTSPSQIIYVDDPLNFPTNQNEIIDYLNNNVVYSIQPSVINNQLIIGDKLKIGNFIKEKNNIYQTQYFNYAILPLLLSSPQNYDFYGPY